MVKLKKFLNNNIKHSKSKSILINQTWQHKKNEVKNKVQSLFSQQIVEDHHLMPAGNTG
jgi:hypothetical protein